MQTKCSCPDWSNPCKHIAAVYYLLGEEFDRDPFLIFALRGLARDDLVALLGRSGVAVAPAVEAAPSPPEPLSAKLDAFWGGSKSPAEDLGEVEPPPVTAALPRRLGGFPFWRGGQPFLQAIEPSYTRATPRGLDAVLGQAPGTNSPEKPTRPVAAKPDRVKSTKSKVKAKPKPKLGR